MLWSKELDKYRPPRRNGGEPKDHGHGERGETVHGGKQGFSRPTYEVSDGCARLLRLKNPIGQRSWTSGSAQPSSRRGDGFLGRAIGRCTSGSEELTVRDGIRSHRHGRIHIHIHIRATCWNRRLGSKESNSQLPDFVPRHRVGPPSGVPARNRTTHSTVEGKKRNFGRLRQRSRGLYRYIIQADAAVVVCRRSTKTIAVSLKTLPDSHPSRRETLSPLLLASARAREKIRSMKPFYVSRITGSGVSGEAVNPWRRRSSRRASPCRGAQRLPVQLLRKA